ncbi:MULTISPECIES: hypothetical protein [unclassified Cupriavidus]|uniref:hypothetical protein n=1 Tax=Cupriavidus sp. H19C3 TaxID=3241603 RepID=UPI003BF86A77
MQSIPPTLWPMTAFFPHLQAFASADGQQLTENWSRWMGLNTDFARSMFDEARFDWASMFVPQDPESLYVRQMTNQVPMLSIPLHYASALMELGCQSQRVWMDTWGHWLGMPSLLMGTAPADQPGARNVEDVPHTRIRETPHPRGAKSKSH